MGKQSEPGEPINIVCDWFFKLLNDGVIPDEARLSSTAERSLAWEFKLTQDLNPLTVNVLTSIFAEPEQIGTLFGIPVIVDAALPEDQVRFAGPDGEATFTISRHKLVKG